MQEIFWFIEGVASSFNFVVNGMRFIVVLQVDVEAVNARQIPNETVLSLFHIYLLIFIVKQLIFYNLVDWRFVLAMNK